MKNVGDPKPSVELALARTEGRLASMQTLIAAGTDLDLEVMLPKLLEVVAFATDSDQGGIFLVDADGKELVLAAHRGFDGPLEPRHRTLPIDGCLTGDAMQRLEPRALSVSQLPSERWDAKQLFGVEEIAIIPLHIKGHRAGSLNLGRTRPEPYTPDDLKWAETLAAQIAVRIENARLYAEAQKRLRHLSLLLELTRAGTESRGVTAVLERTLDPMAKAFSAAVLTVHLVSEKQLKLAGHRIPWRLTRGLGCASGSAACRSTERAW